MWGWTADYWQKKGKAYIGKRCKQSGLYGRTDKDNLLLAISGAVNGWRWADIWTGEGTTGERMIDFVGRILNDLGPGMPGNRYCFIMDNLSWVIPYFSNWSICLSLILIQSALQLSPQSSDGDANIPGWAPACFPRAILSSRWPDRVRIQYNSNRSAHQLGRDWGRPVLNCSGTRCNWGNTIICAIFY